MEKNKTYKMNVFCKNCNFKEEIEIPKGIVVEKQSCPNCDTVNLEKDFNYYI